MIQLLKQFIKTQEGIMQGLTDLQKSVSDLTGAVSGAVTLINSQNTQIASLTSQLAAANATIASLQASGTGDSDADVEAASQAIEGQVTALNAAVSPVSPSPTAIPK